MIFLHRPPDLYRVHSLRQRSLYPPPAALGERAPIIPSPEELETCPGRLRLQYEMIAPFPIEVPTS